MAQRSLLFVFNHEYPELWQDGLWAAINELRKTFIIDPINLFLGEDPIEDSYDFILGWGAFNSPVDQYIKSLGREYEHTPKGLCIAGNAVEPVGADIYDLFFCETDWYMHKYGDSLETPFVFKAFGINRDVYYPRNTTPEYIWDYLSVGSFSYWKRHTKILNKSGNKMVVGEIQKGNLAESMDIISDLISGGSAVSDMVDPDRLATMYSMSKVVYIPADINGGGERAVWEARSCGAIVEVADDNPKLQELVSGSVRYHIDYAEKIKNGIYHVLRNINK